MADSIFSSDGVFADPPGFLKPAIEAVRRHGGLFIADEVQPGFGRTGAGMWGFERHGVVPDIVTMGKPMGNGFPMGGVATRPDLLDRFTAEVKYFNTFGGNPVAAAAGLAVLDVIRDEGLMENAAATGAYFAEGLRALGNRHAPIGDVRGAGLLHRPRTRARPRVEDARAGDHDRDDQWLAPPRRSHWRRGRLRQHPEDPAAPSLYERKRRSGARRV